MSVLNKTLLTLAVVIYIVIMCVIQVDQYARIKKMQSLVESGAIHYPHY